jgi:CyaY protein
MNNPAHEEDSRTGHPAGAAGRPGLSDLEFRRETDALLARIEATADRWLQEDVIDIDSQRSGGLLELAFPDGSKIIINTQPPLREVWLAARGGGFHYRWAQGLWLDTRDGSELLQALSQHASAQAGKPLRFSA